MAKIGIDVRLWRETGIGRYIRNLVSELAQIDENNQYVLFARTADASEIRSLIHNSKFIIQNSDIRWHSIQEQVEFPRLLNKYSLDLVHFPYFSVPVFYNKPYIITVHDLIINHFPTGKASSLPFPFYTLKRFGYSFVLKKSIQAAKCIISPSEATKAEIVDHYKAKKDKVIVTPEGIDESISDFEPVIFKKKNPYFLYVGNGYPHKNLERLLDAFKVFSIKHPVFSIKLVGKEDYFYKRLKDYVSKKDIKNVEFLGYATDTQLSRFYREAKATFMPSLMEGFGLTALEAMKMGSLVAVSKIPSLEEVCKNHSFYFNPTDVLSIVKVMEEVFAIPDEEREKKVEAAKKYSSNFSWKKMAKLTLEAYRSCLGK